MLWFGQEEWGIGVCICRVREEQLLRLPPKELALDMPVAVVEPAPNRIFAVPDEVARS